MSTPQRPAASSRRSRLALPDHPLLRPIERLPEWAHLLMGDETAFIELPEVVESLMVVQITHDGAGPFNFQLLDVDGLSAVLDVEGTGHLCERRSVNLVRTPGFKYILANVTGPWILHFQTLREMRRLDAVPGTTVDGDGSDLLLVQTRRPTRIDFALPYSDGGVEIHTLGAQRRRVVNTFSSYSGTFIAGGDLVGLEIITRRTAANDTRWRVSIGPTSGAPS